MPINVTAPVGRPPSRPREPQPQGIRGLQLRIDAFRGVADTFGTFNKPVGPIRNTAYAAPAARPTDRCRSRALRPWRPRALAVYRRPRLRACSGWPFGLFRANE